MSTQKTPAALIQVLDAQGKVSNYEVEYIVVYTGDDPNIARNFKPSRDREEVTPDVFAELVASSEAIAAEDAREVHAKNAELQDVNRLLAEQVDNLAALVNASTQAQALDAAKVEAAAEKARADAALARVTLLDAAVAKAAKVFDEATAALRARDERIAFLEQQLGAV